MYGKFFKEPKSPTSENPIPLKKFSHEHSENAYCGYLPNLTKKDEATPESQINDIQAAVKVRPNSFTQKNRSGAYYGNFPNFTEKKDHVLKCHIKDGHPDQACRKRLTQDDRSGAYINLPGL